MVKLTRDMLKMNNIWSLLKVAASCRRIKQWEFQSFVRTKKKYSTTRQRHPSCILFIRIYHAKFCSQLSFFISNDWERELVHFRMSFNIFYPFKVRFNSITRKCNQLNLSFYKFFLKLSKSTKLCGTDWCKISRMGKEKSPAVRKKVN